MRPLLSDSQLLAIQAVGQSGMKVDVIFRRPDWDENDVPIEPVPIVARCKGYLRQTGGATVGGVDMGMITTSSTFELGVPIGTNVLPRDNAEIGGRIYEVQDVLDDETWPAMLNVTLRHRS